MGVNILAELADLTACITSTSFYKDYCYKISSSCCHFSKDGHLLVISVNNLVYVFTFHWNAGEQCVLEIKLAYCYLCKEVITSLCLMDDFLLYGTNYGHVYKLMLDSSFFQYSSSSLISPPTTNSPLLVNVVNECVEREVGLDNICVVASLLDTETMLQSSITKIQVNDRSILLSDTVHIGLYDFAFNPIFSHSVSEGFIDAFFVGDKVYCLSTSFSFMVIHPWSQHPLQTSQSLLPSFQQYFDFGVYGMTCVAQQGQGGPVFLVLSSCVNGVMTTSVDYRYQLLSLLSISPSSRGQHGQHGQHGQLGKPFLPCFSPTLLTQSQLLDSNDILNDVYPVELLYTAHIGLCHLIQSSPQSKESKESKESICSILLAIQRKLLAFTHLQRRNHPISTWILNKLGALSGGDGNCGNEIERECECCRRRVIANENHAEWCGLANIDLYCWYSLRPILQKPFHTCPCCLHSYLEGDRCIFCNLPLVWTDQLPAEFKVVGREVLFRNQSILAEWNCV